MKIKPSDLLLAAKELINSPEKWTMKVFARNKIEFEVDPTSFGACKWCAVGAVIHEAKRLKADEESALVFLRRATKDWGIHGAAGSPPILNDRGNHAEVMKMFDRAIELAKLKENESATI